MKFENKGKWMKEAEEDKLVFDNREPADYLNGDDEICTLKTEDDESDYDDFSGELLDEVESEDFEDELDSPENEEDAIVMSESMPPINQRKRIEFEDDIVRVYDGNKEIYAGAEDYEPMQDENWKWDDANKYYKFGKYIKVCCESSQKNEATMSDIKAKLKGAKEVPIGHYKRGNEQTIVANDSKGEHRLIISDTGYARLLERLNANGRGEKVVEKVFKLNESSQKNEALDKEKAMELIGAWKSSLMGDNGDFEMHLAKACQHADKNNLMKLEKAFPQLLQKFCAWKSSGRTDKVAQL